MKVECFRDGVCKFCETGLEFDDGDIHVGDVFTVMEDHEFPSGWRLFCFAERPLYKGRKVFYCSCCFRPLGDPDAWAEIIKKCKPKEKSPERELEDA